MLVRFQRLVTLTLCVSASALAQTIAPPFNSTYSIRRLGLIAPGGTYGGTVFHHANANVLLYGAYASGQILAVPVTRDGQGHITGFGTATVHATLPDGPDGGLAYGPNNVLFYTVFGSNQLGQIPVGSPVPTKIVDLYPLGLNGSVGACAFTPAGHPAAGRLKVLTWPNAEWREATLSPDGLGTFDIPALGAPTTLIGVSPEGILYPPTNAPGLQNQVLIANWSYGRIDAFATDQNGDPLPASGAVMADLLSGPGGGVVDPVTGDLLFTELSGDAVLIRAVATCGSFRIYGQGSPGLTGIPAIAGAGCARVGSGFTVSITGGRPNALGAMVVGFYEWNLPVFNLHLLNDGYATLSHLLSPTGAYNLPIAVPPSTIYGNTDIYFQGGYFDAATPFGFASSRGLHVHID